MKRKREEDVSQTTVRKVNKENGETNSSCDHVFGLVVHCGYLSGDEMLRLKEASPWREVFQSSSSIFWPTCGPISFTVKSEQDLMRCILFCSHVPTNSKVRLTLSLGFTATDKTVLIFSELGKLLNSVVWSPSTLSYFREGLTSEGLQSLCSLESLHTIVLGNGRLNEHKLSTASFHSFLRLPHLTHLNLSGNRAICDSKLSIISRANGLTHLCLDRCVSITSKGVELLWNLPQLMHLSLVGCMKVCDVGLEQVKKSSKLNTLNLSYCEKLTDTGLMHISRRDTHNNREPHQQQHSPRNLCLSIQALHLRGCQQITDLGLSYVANIDTLTQLNFSSCLGLTDTGLGYLSRLPMLRKLNLVHCISITKRGLRRLCSTTVATSLDISSSLCVLVRKTSYVL